VNQTSDQSLVWNPFSCRFSLDSDQVVAAKSNINSFILLEGIFPSLREKLQ
jgi:hypothetical protein